MKKSWREISCMKILLSSMEILYSYIFMHKNEYFAPGMHDVFAQEIFMGSWPVHNFMHGIFAHENLLGKTFIFMHENLISCMEISFSCMKMKICCMKYSSHAFFMHDIFSYGSNTGTPELAWDQLRKYRI